MFLRISLICACSFSLFSTCVSAGGGLIIISAYWNDGAITGLSADGSVASGYVLTQNDDRAFIWNVPDGVTLIDLVQGDTYSRTLSISDDGLRILGDGEYSKFTWTKATGTQQTTALNSITAWSDDGLMFVGSEPALGPDDPLQASKFSGGITTRLGILPTTGTTKYSIATDVSADGSVIVGDSTSDLSAFSSSPEAFIWTAESGMVGLGVEVNEVIQRETSAKVVSPNGEIIAGESMYIPEGLPVWQVFRWAAETGVVSVMSEGYDLEVSGMSTDGSVIVGTGLNYDENMIIPWIWTEGIGKQTLFEWLADAGVDTGDWDAGKIFAVSAEGKAVGGLLWKTSEGGDSSRPFVAWVNDLEPLPELIFGGRGGSMEDPLIP